MQGLWGSVFPPVLVCAGRSAIMKYRICWKSKVNSEFGKSDAMLDWFEAKQIAEDLNQEFPTIEH
jgi:hypothetical protein